MNTHPLFRPVDVISLRDRPVLAGRGGPPAHGICHIASRALTSVATSASLLASRSMSRSSEQWRQVNRLAVPCIRPSLVREPQRQHRRLGPICQSLVVSAIHPPTNQNMLVLPHNSILC